MRFMMLVKASKESEAGALPSKEQRLRDELEREATR
jgi:hypothetical protein